MTFKEKFQYYMGGIEYVTILLFVFFLLIGIHNYSTTYDLYSAGGWFLASFGFAWHIYYQKKIFKMNVDTNINDIYIYALERYSNLSKLYESNPLHDTEIADMFTPDSLDKFADTKEEE